MSPAGLLTKGEYRVAKFAHDWKPRTRRVAKCGCKCKVELPGTARSGLQSPICKSRPRIFLAYGWIHQQARSWRDPEECRRNHNNGSPVIWPRVSRPTATLHLGSGCPARGTSRSSNMSRGG